MTSFLGCCVQLLQILMEVTGLLVKNQSPLSFIPFYVSKDCRAKHGEWPELGIKRIRVLSRHIECDFGLYPENPRECLLV